MKKEVEQIKEYQSFEDLDRGATLGPEIQED